MRTWRRHLLLGLIGGALAVAGCAPAAPTAAPLTARAPAAPDELLGQIPHDTPYAWIAGGGRAAFGGLAPRELLGELRTALRPVLADLDDDVAGKPPAERAALIALRTASELADADLVRLGIANPATRATLYGWGLVPVLRVELDGALLRQLYDRVIAEAGLDQPFQRWHGHAYLTWPLGGLELVAVVRDRQVAVALAHRAADVLPHLVGDAPPARHLEPGTIGRGLELEGEPAFFVDPSRLAALIGDVTELRRLAATATPACATALAALIRALPPVAGSTSASASANREPTSHVVLGPAPALAQRLAQLARPIPRWPGPPTARVMMLGLGLAPLETADLVAGFLDDVLATTAACGGKGGGAGTARAALRAAALPLALVRGLTVVMHEVDAGAPMPLQLELIADVTDPVALYAWLAARLGLPPRPPAFATPTPLVLGAGLPLTLVLEPTTIAVTIGHHDAAAFAALRAAPRGPAALLRVSHGGGFADPRHHRPVAFELTLRGDTVRIDIRDPRDRR